MDRPPTRRKDGVMPSKDSIRRIGDYFLELVAENNIFFHQSFRSVEEITAPVLKKVLNFFGRSFQDFFWCEQLGLSWRWHPTKLENSADLCHPLHILICAARSPSWLRQRFAKPSFAGSNPARALLLSPLGAPAKGLRPSRR